MSDEENSNSGNRNSGNRNSGDSNSGNRNSGNRNSGNRNSGDSNSGDRNSGNRNSGDWNSGNWNSGYFCTQEGPVYFFDTLTGLSRKDASALIPHVDLPVGCKWVASESMTDEEKQKYPSHKTIGGFLKVLHRTVQEAFPEAWAKMDDKTRQRFLDLPNFDAEKFLACTGVDVRAEASSKPLQHDEITVEGKRYRLVLVDSATE